MQLSRKFAVGCAVGVASLLVGGAAIAAGAGDNWTSAGHDLKNTRYQHTETTIGAGNAGNLAVKWVFTTGGDVSATPAVDESKVYAPDWAGNLYALDRATGAQVWSKQVSEYTGVPGDLARVTPVVAGNRLILGNQRNFGNLFPDPGAYVFAVNKNTGALLWKTKIDDHFAAFVTQSAVVDGNVAYVGVSSARRRSLPPGLPVLLVPGQLPGARRGPGRSCGRPTWCPPGGPGSGLGQHSRRRQGPQDRLHHDRQQLHGTAGRAGLRGECPVARGRPGVHAGRRLLRLGARPGHGDRRDQVGHPGASLRRLECRLHPVLR